MGGGGYSAPRGLTSRDIAEFCNIKTKSSKKNSGITMFVKICLKILLLIL